MFLRFKLAANFLIIIFLSFATFSWTFFIFHKPFDLSIVLSVIIVRELASFVIMKDYSMRWSKASPQSFLIKSSVSIAAFLLYMPFFYTKIEVYFMVSELFTYLFSINFFMYVYYFLTNRSSIEKTTSVVIYGAGKAGIKLKDEFRDSKYKIKYFVDDNKNIENSSIDSIRVLSKKKLKKKLADKKLDMLVIAMPSSSKERVKEIYDNLSHYFKAIKILPTIEEILQNKDFSTQLKDISVEDLLARNPKDLDKEKISAFIKDKTVLITGAGGSIGSEICRQCHTFGAKKLILLDNSEFNLYTITEEFQNINIIPVMQSVVNLAEVEKTFYMYKPDIVIHAAAYKHVPLVEANIDEGIKNNIIGTKNVIDMAIKYEVEKFVMISTDKAVRPTNVMGTTKRVCELYAQNKGTAFAKQNVSLENIGYKKNIKTEIVSVRFGNVLGSSGSVIPKFKAQIQNRQNITVTHPDITRYFMLIPEACELVLQAGAIGNGGEIFILDMGEPIKIVDLAKKMIKLSGREDIGIVFSGLRPGEKLYEELLIDDTDAKTQYESITVAHPTKYDINKLNADIEELIESDDKLTILKRIVPEFNHQTNA